MLRQRSAHLARVGSVALAFFLNSQSRAIQDVTFVESSPFTKSCIEWGPDTFQFIVFESTTPPWTLVSGKLAQECSLEIGGKKVSVSSERGFEERVELNGEANTFPVSVTEPSSKSTTSNLHYEWKKMPPHLAMTIQDGSKKIKVVDKIKGKFASNEWLKTWWGESQTSSPVQKTDWYRFGRFNSLLVLPSPGGISVSPQVSWNPRIPYDAPYSFGGNISLTVIKLDATSMLLAYEMGPVFIYHFPILSIEVGPAFHAWSEFGGMGWGAQSYITVPIAPLLNDHLRGVFLGYSAFFSTSSATTHEIKLGAEFYL